MCQRDTEHLQIWVKKYNILAAQGTKNLINERGDITEDNLAQRSSHHFTKSYLKKMIYCTECNRYLGLGEEWISESIPSWLTGASLAMPDPVDTGCIAKNGVRDGSPDPSFPAHLAHMGTQNGKY